LVFSNGIVILAVFAGLLIVAFGGDTTRLIPLYAVGVFVAFTISQAGMVVHHRKDREPAWKRGAVINGIGCVATFIVALVIMTSKFKQGAWVPMVVIPIVMLLLWVTHKHYVRVANLLRVEPDFRPVTRGNTVVVLVSGVHRSSLQALEYARRLRPDHLVCASAADTEQAERIREDWARFGITQELDIIDSPYREVTRPLLEFLDELELRWPDCSITVVLPELVVERWWEQLLHNQSALALKARLLFRKGTIVVSVPLHLNPKYHEVNEGEELHEEEERADANVDVL
jgi:hypothetical protein